MPLLSNRRCAKRVGLLCLTLFSVFLPLGLQGQGDSAAVGQRSLRAELRRDYGSKPHSPRKALLLSAVLPGAGQVYNGQAWKIPIIYAAIGGVGYVTYSNFVEMRAYKEEYLYRVHHDGAVQNSEMASTPTANIYSLYEAYNKTFQLSVIISVAVYGLNLLDAYVFGHLYDFQINDDLTLNFAPTLMPVAYGFSSGPLLTPSASLTLRF